MSKIDKLLDKMRNNPRDWRIEDIKKVCESFDLEYDFGKGDHFNIKHPNISYILTIPAHRPIKPIYIKKLLQMLEEVENV